MYSASKKGGYIKSLSKTKYMSFFDQISVFLYFFCQKNIIKSGIKSAIVLIQKDVVVNQYTTRNI